MLYSQQLTVPSLVLEWIGEEFVPENRRRLKAAHSYVTGQLQSLGVPYLDRHATLFVWADLRKVLRPTLCNYGAKTLCPFVSISV